MARPIPAESLAAVRPYLRIPARPKSAEEAAQEHRRWELDMAARGIDVGPTTIHGVHVQPGTWAARLVAA